MIKYKIGVLLLILIGLAGSGLVIFIASKTNQFGMAIGIIFAIMIIITSIVLSIRYYKDSIRYYKDGRDSKTDSRLEIRK